MSWYFNWWYSIGWYLKGNYLTSFRPLPSPPNSALPWLINCNFNYFHLYFKCFLSPHIYGVISVGWSTLILKSVKLYIRTLPTIHYYVILLIKTLETNVGDVCQFCKTLQYLIFPGYLCFVTDETQAWYRRDKQFTILHNCFKVACWICCIYNIENILFTELKIRFLLPDLTPVQSKMVVLRILGYSRTQQAERLDLRIFSESRHCHLGIIFISINK